MGLNLELIRSGTTNKQHSSAFDKVVKSKMKETEVMDEDQINMRSLSGEDIVKLSNFIGTNKLYSNLSIGARSLKVLWSGAIIQGVELEGGFLVSGQYKTRHDGIATIGWFSFVSFHVLEQ